MIDKTLLQVVVLLRQFTFSRSHQLMRNVVVTALSAKKHKKSPLWEGGSYAPQGRGPLGALLNFNYTTRRIALFFPSLTSFFLFF